MATTLYPTPSAASFSGFIGQPLSALPTPSLILDHQTVLRNCARLGDAARALGISFRPHVKTHKTTEITCLQLKSTPNSGGVIVSTVAEALALEPLVREGTVVDILYGLPLPPSALPRLADLRNRNPTLTISLLIDHPDQIPVDVDGGPWNVFVKLDNGDHRAGLQPSSSELRMLLEAVSAAETRGVIQMTGLYSYSGHSYGGSSAAESLQCLLRDVDTVLAGAAVWGEESKKGRELVLSVGATPTALAAEGGVMREMVARVRAGGWQLELHAGVYTMLDLQQLATRPEGLGLQDVALTVLAEVVSLYPSRGEALVALGSTGLGREPSGKSGLFPGWGTVTGWTETEPWDGSLKSGWVVDRISQEHAILTKEEGIETPMGLKVGMKIRVWPQHACIAGNAHGWYFVTDGTKVTDVWVRWRGW